MKTGRIVLGFSSMAFAFMWVCCAQAASLTITAEHGSVTAIPNKAVYADGEVVRLLAKPQTGYCFSHWSGDARGRALTLELAINGDKAVTANFGPWTPPIGIPTPDFGVLETHRLYEGKTYDFGSGPEPYRDAGNGPYTHYIDNTSPGATDTDNPYGTPITPRRSIPTDLPRAA